MIWFIIGLVAFIVVTIRLCCDEWYALTTVAGSQAEQHYNTTNYDRKNSFHILPL